MDLKRNRIAIGTLSALCSFLLCGNRAAAQDLIAVTTQHNNNERTGANLVEYRLKIENINIQRFGKFAEFSVDGDIYGQPLYLGKSYIYPPVKSNTVYVATMSNTVYSFDADSRARTEIWRAELEKPVPVEDVVSSLTSAGCPWAHNVSDIIQKNIGIVGTPVIDIQGNAIYVVTFTEIAAGKYAHYIHALDLKDKHELFGGPRKIETPVDSKPKFDSLFHLQRAALLLSKGSVYVAFGALGDCPTFYGWIFRYGARDLKLQTFFNTAPGDAAGKDAGGGGIWQAGQGPAADTAGNIYVMSGNGGFSTSGLELPLGSSFIKLDPSLKVLSRFTPRSSKADLDLDLGSGGPLLLPVVTRKKEPLLIGGGKDGMLFLLNRDNLGGYSRDKDNTVQAFLGTHEPCTSFLDNDDDWWKSCNQHPAVLAPARSSFGYYHIHGSPVFWQNPYGSFLYVWGEADYLHRFKFNGETGTFNTPPVTNRQAATPTRSMPGAVLSLSAMGSREGIVWATHPIGCSYIDDGTKCTNPKDPKCWCDANARVVPGVIRAFEAYSNDPNRPLRELWSTPLYCSEAGKDVPCNVAKFTPVTVANGKVYVATFSNRLLVYGPK
jgi:hypothetical protein